MNQGLLGQPIPQAPAVTEVVSAYLAADVTMTSANTYYDGPSVTLGPGRWLVIAAADCSAASTAFGQGTAKVWDGTTSWGAGESQENATGGGTQIHVTTYITLDKTTVVKISAATQQANSTMRTTLLVNGTGAGNPTYIIAIRLA